MTSAWSTPTTVNTTDSGAGGDDQRDAQVVELSNGNILVAWVDESRASFNSSGSTIVGQLYDSSGTAIGGEIDLVPMYSDGNQDDVAIAATNDGGFVVAFSDVRPGGDEFVRVARFDSAGTSAWTFSGNEAHQTVEGTLGTDTTADPSIAVLADGRIAVVVENVDTGGDIAIRYQTIAADGTGSTSGTAASSATSDFFDPEILQHGHGDVSLVYAGQNRTTPTSTSAEWRDGSYDTLTGALAFGSAMQLDSGSDDGGGPSVANLANGDYVLVWEEAPNNTDWESTATWVFNSSDVAQTNYTDRQLGNYTAHLETGPSVTGLDNGGYAVFWTDEDDGTIEGRIYNASYTADGGVFRIPSSVIPGTASDPDVVQLADGRLLITYDETDGSDNTDVKFVIFDPTADPLIEGTSGPDSLEAGNLPSTLSGLGGNDTLVGGSQDDFLDGGTGADSMTGNAGSDTYVVDDAGDTVTELVGEGTDDTIRSYIDLVLPDFVEHLVLLGATARTGTGNTSDNRITGADYGDTLSGGNGNDTLIGNLGADRLFGEAGDDLLDGGAGNDSLDGGANNDTARFSGSGAFNVDLTIAGGQATGQGNDTLVSIENIISGTGNDDLAGNSGANTLRGNNGSDTLNGRGGADHLLGGGGNDTLDGNGGNDTARLQTGADITVDLAIGGAQASGQGNDTFIAIENVISGGGDDDLAGDGRANILSGNNGSDTLAGRNGNDTLNGGGGDDELQGGGGNDVYNGGNGRDTAILSVAGGVTVDLGIGGAQATGQGSDRFNGIENITAGNGADDLSGNGRANTLTGRGGADTLLGKGGNDRLFGDNGNDQLFGNNGNDTIDGGGGRDTITGGAGNDRLTTGGGNDRLLFDDNFGRDRIVDFNTNGDKVDLSAYSGVSGFGDITQNTDANGNAVAVLGADRIVFVGLTWSDLGANDFIF